MSRASMKSLRSMGTGLRRPECKTSYLPLFTKNIKVTAASYSSHVSVYDAVLMLRNVFTCSVNEYHAFGCYCLQLI